MNLSGKVIGETGPGRKNRALANPGNDALRQSTIRFRAMERSLPMRAHIFCVAVLTLALTAGARADDLADFNTMADAVLSHDRAAAGFLQRGDTEQAMAELAALREAWQALQARFAGKRPAAFDGNPLYGNLMTGVNARLVAVDIMLKSGRPDAARQSLDALREDFDALRKAR